MLTKKQTKKNKKTRWVHEKKWKKEIPIWVFGHLQCFVKPTYVSGMGVGFVGMGTGWTLPTRAVPVCHPKSEHMSHIDPCWDPLHLCHHRHRHCSSSMRGGSPDVQIHVWSLKDTVDHTVISQEIVGVFVDWSGHTVMPSVAPITNVMWICQRNSSVWGHIVKGHTLYLYWSYVCRVLTPLPQCEVPTPCVQAMVSSSPEIVSKLPCQAIDASYVTLPESCAKERYQSRSCTQARGRDSALEIWAALLRGTKDSYSAIWLRLAQTRLSWGVTWSGVGDGALATSWVAYTEERNDSTHYLEQL